VKAVAQRCRLLRAHPSTCGESWLPARFSRTHTSLLVHAPPIARMPAQTHKYTVLEALPLAGPGLSQLPEYWPARADRHFDNLEPQCAHCTPCECTLRAVNKHGVRGVLCAAHIVHENSKCCACFCAHPAHIPQTPPEHWQPTGPTPGALRRSAIIGASSSRCFHPHAASSSCLPLPSNWHSLTVTQAHSPT
jgi:hypothetical protein